MRFNFDGHSLKSGIYKITNTYTSRVYIGQAKEFKRRWNGHKNSLVNGKHQNQFFQADFNKCREALGHDDFLEFHVVEVMEDSTKEQRNKREEELIATVFDYGKQCYNLTTKAISREGKPSKNAEETSRKISEATKAARARPEVQEKQSKRMKKQWEEPGRKEALSERMKVQWSEDGRKEAYGQKIKAIWAEGSEKREQLMTLKKRSDLVELFKRKCHTPEVIAKTASKLTKNHGKVVSPDGSIFEVIGLRVFCQEHGIPLTQLANFSKLLKGQVKSVSGWKRAESVT